MSIVPPFVSVPEFDSDPQPWTLIVPLFISVPGPVTTRLPATAVFALIVAPAASTSIVLALPEGIARPSPEIV